jgi:hypothetical protein
MYQNNAVKEHLDLYPLPIDGPECAGKSRGMVFFFGEQSPPKKNIRLRDLCGLGERGPSVPLYLFRPSP